MSVAGYFASGKNAGLRSDRLLMRLKEDGLLARERAGTATRAAETYARMEKYDAVLRAHGRLPAR